jgi:hypothetical protein
VRSKKQIRASIKRAKREIRNMESPGSFSKYANDNNSFGADECRANWKRRPTQRQIREALEQAFAQTTAGQMAQAISEIGARA